jgi:hypothetical protein
VAQFADSVASSDYEQDDLREIVKAVRCAYAPFSRLVSQMATGLTERRWQTMLLDVRAGWLPGKVLGQIDARVADAVGAEPVQTFALAAGRSATVEMVGSQLEKLPLANGRMLFFTECLGLGACVMKLAHTARQPFDIAAITSDFLTTRYTDIVNDSSPDSGLRDARIYIGSENQNIFIDADNFVSKVSGLTVDYSNGAAIISECQVTRNFELVTNQAFAHLGDVLYEEHFSSL